jgi:hypothetical protein
MREKRGIGGGEEEDGAGRRKNSYRRRKWRGSKGKVLPAVN